MDREHTPASLAEAETLVACLFGIDPGQLHSFVVIVDFECERQEPRCKGIPEHCHTQMTTTLNKYDNDDYADILRMVKRLQEMILR